MNRLFLLSVLALLPFLFSCGEYREITPPPDQPAAQKKREYPIPPEYQEEYKALMAKVSHYHAETLPNFTVTHARAHSRIGFILFKAGNMDKARENLERSINMDEHLGEPHFYLGEVFEAQGKTEAAAGEYEKALKLDPNLAEARRRLADAYEKLGFHDRAVEERNRSRASSQASP
jgi:Tfp pilus assembly protein PilF